MVKVSVVSKNDIWKYIIKIGFIIVILFIIVKVYEYSKKHLTQTQITTTQCISYITEEITAMGSVESNNIFELNPESMLESEFRMSQAVTSRNMDSISNKLQNVENSDNNDNSENNIEATTAENVQNNQALNEEDMDEITDVSTDVKTETVYSKYKNTYNFELKGVKVKNETDYDLSVMNLTTDVSVNNKNIIIFHTHTCESYTPTQERSYQASGNFRTTDLNYNVARVGEELKKYLNSYGYNVIHDKTYHDYPAYSGSYGRSLKTVSSLISQNNDTDVIIDLHRDAIGDDTYAPKVKIGDEYAAQIMFVIGTNGSGLTHENWKQNLEFAMKVQQKANELYPGLFKPILLRDARYNQHLGKAASIIEIGATGNTLEECEVSAKYLAKVLSEVME
ncbi:MAG: stage II sporulation protein P [Clostridia bacterium]|nr:stage II sporulation protein P [Clostridia bacterium]